jgi:naphthalene 1,2-dioxygenase system ferredoxin subunit
MALRSPTDLQLPPIAFSVSRSTNDLVLYNIEGETYATHNICTHAQALLSDSWLDSEVIECPIHGGRFEVKSGKGLGPPITCDLKTFAGASRETSFKSTCRTGPLRRQ